MGFCQKYDNYFPIAGPCSFNAMLTSE